MHALHDVLTGKMRHLTALESHRRYEIQNSLFSQLFRARSIRIHSIPTILPTATTTVDPMHSLPLFSLALLAWAHIGEGVAVGAVYQCTTKVQTCQLGGPSISCPCLTGSSGVHAEPFPPGTAVYAQCSCQSADGNLWYYDNSSWWVNRDHLEGCPDTTLQTCDYCPNHC
jgi:hypothetical protein